MTVAAGIPCLVNSVAGGYSAEWPGLGSLRIQGSSTVHHTYVDDAVAAEKWRRGPAMAVERYLRRTGVGFHASAVSLPSGHAIVFAGASGAGKSTAAAVLCLRMGASLLADDVCIGKIDRGQLWIEPSESQHWLDGPARERLAYPRGQGPKRPVAASSLAHAPIPAAKLVALRDDGPVQPVRLRGLEALTAIAAASMAPHVDAEAQSRAVEDLDRFVVIGRLVEVVACCRLPDDLLLRKLVA